MMQFIEQSFCKEANCCLSSVQVLCISWDPKVMDGIARTRHLFLLEHKRTQLILFRLIYLRPVLILRILPFKHRSGKWLLFIRFSRIKRDTHISSFQCSLLVSFM